MKITHNVQTWFGGGAKLLAFFESSFSMNTIGEFKAPASMVARFNNFTTDDDKIKAMTGLANVYISGMIHTPKSMILKQLPFDWLEEDTQSQLKDAVCEALQHAVLNKLVWERTNASTLSTPNFTMNTDTVSWLLSSDMFGMIAKNAITNSGINDYAWIEEDEYYQSDALGNIKVIGKASLDTITELSL